MNNTLFDAHNALTLLTDIVDYCKKNNLLAGTVFEDSDTITAVADLDKALLLLDEFKLWYNLDIVDRVRGKRQLKYLKEFIDEQHEKEQ